LVVPCSLRSPRSVEERRAADLQGYNDRSSAIGTTDLVPAGDISR
jgi:hypothetical protein